MRLMLGVTAIACLLAAPALASMSVVVNTGPYSNSFTFTTPKVETITGGEFVATPSGFWSAHAVTALNGKFETFCIERTEHLTFDTKYSVTLDDYAIGGGANHISEEVGGVAVDYLDGRTAWLYCQFIRGELDGYDYGAGRKDSAAALQYAIWFIEDEVTQAQLDAFTFADKAKQFITDSTDMSSSCTRVVNLFDASGNAKQSILVCIPAPGAAILGMLGLGLIGWVKRRMA